MEYFINRPRFAFVTLPLQSLPILMMGALAYGSITTGVTYKVVTGILILALISALLWYVSRPLREPTVRITEKGIEVLGVLGVHRVNDVQEYTLVLAGSWVGFRRKGQNDIIVDKGDFSKPTWESLLAHVQQLPFAGVV